MHYLNYIQSGGKVDPKLLMYIVPALTVFVLWSLFWKGMALWHSAKRGDKIWFIVLLVLNTLGIVEICYLLFVAKIKFFKDKA
ncbi:MAG: DUF5652 family protein [Candidatus Pacebacteria bacterium]|nr:DUF5652 family protein [Candidatus Paceibacterota bacterium]